MTTIANDRDLGHALLFTNTNTILPVIIGSPEIDAAAHEFAGFRLPLLIEKYLEEMSAIAGSAGTVEVGLHHLALMRAIHLNLGEPDTIIFNEGDATTATQVYAQKFDFITSAAERERHAYQTIRDLNRSLKAAALAEVA